MLQKTVLTIDSTFVPLGLPPRFIHVPITAPYPYAIQNDTMIIHFDSREIVLRNYFLTFIVRDGLKFDNQGNCNGCLRPDTLRFFIASEYKCENNCLNEITYNNETEPDVLRDNIMVPYASKLDKTLTEKPNWIIDSSYMLIKNGIYADNFGNNPLTEGVNSIISPNDDIVDVAILLGNDHCALSTNDTVSFNAYYSEKNRHFAFFDEEIDVLLIKQNGDVVNQRIMPYDISFPSLAKYDLSSMVEKFSYNLTPFFIQNNFGTGDSIFIRRTLKAAPNEIGAPVQLRAHEMFVKTAMCTKEFGESLFQHFNIAAPGFKVEMRDPSSSYAPSFDWLTVAYRLPSSVVMDFNYLLYSSGANKYRGFKSYVVPLALEISLPSNSFLRIDTIRNVFTGHPLNMNKILLPKSNNYQIDSIFLFDENGQRNAYSIPVDYLHLINQDDTIDFKYTYKFKDRQGIYDEEVLTRKKIVSSIKYRFVIENKLQEVNDTRLYQWPITYTNVSHNQLKNSNYYINKERNYSIQNTWILVKANKPNIQFVLKDIDKDSVLLPLVINDGYYLYKFDSLQNQRFLRFEAISPNCESFDIDYYSAACAENPAEYFDFFKNNLGSLFKKNTLRIVATSPTLEKTFSIKSISEQNCGQLTLTGSYTNFSNKSIKVAGLVIEYENDLTLVSHQTTKNNKLLNSKNSQDTICLDSLIILYGITMDSFVYTINASISCPFYDDGNYVIKLLYIDDCGIIQNDQSTYENITLFPKPSVTNALFEIMLEQVSNRCGPKPNISLSLNASQDLLAGDIIKISPSTGDMISNLSHFINMDNVKIDLINNEIVIELQNNLGQLNALSFSMDYEKNCSLSCEPTNWKLIHYKAQDLACNSTCKILSEQIDTTLAIDFSLDLAGLSKDTVWSDLSGIHFEFKPNGKTYNDTVQVELYSDVDANGQITDQDILYNSGNALLFNDVDGNPYLLFTSSNSRACNLLARITADCSCDTLIFDFVLPQAEPTPIIYPVCILDPLTFTLPNLNAQEVVWPNSDFLSETNRTGAVYTNPEITADDTVRIQFIDEFGCTLTFPLVFTPGIKDLEIQIIKPENCDADATSKITLSTQSMLNNVSINGVMQDDTAQLYLPAGEHILVLTDNLNCMVQRTISIDSLLNPQIQSIIAVAPTCSGGQNGTATISLSFESERFTYFIDKQPIDTLFTNQLSPGSHLFEVVDSLGCKDSLNFEVLNRMPFLAKTDSLEAICDGLTVDFSNLIFENGTAPYSYSFDSIFFTDQIRRTLDVFNEDTTLFVRDKNGCTVSFPIHLTNKPKSYLEVFTDTVLAYGTVLELGIQNPAEFPDLTWVSDQMLSCTSCPNPKLVVEAYTSILLKGLDTDQCEDSIKIEIRLLEVNLENIFPNVFVPSSGTENNVFKIEKNNLIHSIEAFEVFDRYGNSVFQQSNADEVSWDGNFGGKPCAEGVYVFQTAVTINDQEKTKKQFTGTITLIR
ncbi:MAG: gliding motility-associated C-terminal domain-containing protein [Saprospiraceae bacterium]|nr:gliding motility-associated C-terminal domain-containing protein [Saprospiraceae bacterium]